MRLADEEEGASVKITDEQAIAAEEHMRFVLNTIEGILGVLGTTIHVASSSSQAQPETKQAFTAVEEALNKAFGIVADERTRASTALRYRVLGISRKKS